MALAKTTLCLTARNVSVPAALLTSVAFPSLLWPAALRVTSATTPWES